MENSIEQESNPRIIIIDDNKSIHEDFKKILIPVIDTEKQTLSALEDKLFADEFKTPENTMQALPHFSLSFASQGQEGVEYIKEAVAQKKPFALAFVDIRMPPGWDGIETVQEIWKIDPWIQIVICTAYSDYSWNEMIVKLGVSDNLIILKKPFDVVEVQQLAASLTGKWVLNAKLQQHVSGLEDVIQKRTFELEKSLALVRATLDATTDGILVEDLEGKLIDYNNVFFEMWKIPKEILGANLSKPVFDYLSTQLRDPEAFLDRTENAQKNAISESVVELNLKDARCFEQYCKPHRVNENIVGRVWSFRDISEQKEMQKELLFQATHDKLTNLPNRRLLYDRITQAISIVKRTQGSVSVLLFDLDKFKGINDSLGHAAGDAVLKLIAKRVLEVLRTSDTFGRLGGDEFVVVSVDTNEPSRAEEIAKKIIEVVAKSFTLYNHEFSLSASIGISVFPKDGETPEVLLQKADGAMYSVKNSGKHNFKFFKDDIAQQVLQQLTLENDLRNAIAQNQLELYYQPLMSIESGKIKGAEALIRWNHPRLGILGPDAFIPIAEENGLIVPIGEWVLKTACIQNKKWQNEGIAPLKVAVNVSSIQFKYPLFDLKVKDILHETGLDPAYLELELTETTIVENPIFMLEILEKIKDLGVELVVDDFGTGYSSLSYLRKFPFTKLKIDKTFIADICTNKNDVNLVHTIINMGKNLNLRVLAEGVETIEQLALLKEHHCDEAQGYLFSKPLPVDTFVNFLNSKK